MNKQELLTQCHAHGLKVNTRMRKEELEQALATQVVVNPATGRTNMPAATFGTVLEGMFGIHEQTGVQVLGEDDLVEAEVDEIKDRLGRVVNTFAHSTMPSAYRRVAQQARMHKNTRIYPNTQQDWIRKGWGIIETARSMNRAYARGER